MKLAGIERRTAFALGALGAAAIFLAMPALAYTETAEPDAFLEYIEATGTQYIDTGVNAETGLKARFDMEWGAVVTPASSSGGDDWSMLDARKDSGNTRFYMCHIARKSTNDGFVFGYGYNTWHRTSTDPGRETRHEILTDFSDQTTLHAYKNGTEMLDNGQRTGHASETIDLNLNLYLFACNYNLSASYLAHAKLYGLKIFKKNVSTGGFDLLRHYLPCRKGDKYGLYDKANGTISYSDGAENFVPGPELPKPAAFVEWVEADGTTSSSVAQQYVDTGVWGKLGLKSSVDVMLQENSGDHAILAARASGTGDYRLYMAYHYNGYFCYGDGKLREPKTEDAKPVKGTRYLIEGDLSVGSQSVKVNGTELNNGTFSGTVQFATDSTLALFANNHKGAYVKNPSHSRLYSAKIWDGDELLRDFVPCLADDGEVGLYDIVSRRVFKPSKAFDKATQVGAVTNVLVEVAAPKTRIEYVDSDGVSDYVNLDIIGKDGVEMEAVMEWLTKPDDDVFVGARPTSGNTRFFLYNAWPAHSIGYGKELPRLTGTDRVDGDSSALEPSANTKYRISSRLDAADQFMAVSEWTNNGWSPRGRTQRNYGGPMNTELPFYLFARNYIGKPDSFANVRLYSLKLREKQQNGKYELVRALVPVSDPLTGGVALWDKVTEKYYRSRGNLRLAGGGAERPLHVGFVISVK